MAYAPFPVSFSYRNSKNKYETWGAMGGRGAICWILQSNMKLGQTKALGRHLARYGWLVRKLLTLAKYANDFDLLFNRRLHAFDTCAMRS